MKKNLADDKFGDVTQEHALKGILIKRLVGAANLHEPATQREELYKWI
jgi:hypothetical protein